MTSILRTGTRCRQCAQEFWALESNFSISAGAGPSTYSRATKPRNSLTRIRRPLSSKSYTEASKDERETLEDEGAITQGGLFFRVSNVSPLSKSIDTQSPDNGDNSAGFRQPSTPSALPTPLRDIPLQTLSTYNTITDQLLQDPILAHFPDIAPLIPVSNPRPTPIPQHHISPQTRSAALSVLNRLSSSPPPRQATSSQLFRAYTDLYMKASHSQHFTASEMQDVLRALKTLQVREAGDSQVGVEQISLLVEDIKLLVGDEQAAQKGLELLILSSKSLHNRHVRHIDIERAEMCFQELFPLAPSVDDVKGRRRFQACLNLLMNLCAQAGKESLLNQWWHRMEREGLRPDGYTWMTRMICAVRSGRGEEVAEILSSALNDHLEEKDMTILVNYALTIYGRLEKWNEAIDVYSVLRPSTEKDDLAALQSAQTLDFSHSGPSRAIPLPTISISITRRTYSSLLQSLSLQGNLPAALTILKHMIEDKHSPSIEDYISFFRGFAAHGDIPATTVEPSPAGEMLGVSGRGVPGISLGDRGKSFEERMSGIWARGTMLSQSPPSSIVETYQESHGWNQEVLENLFESFLSLRPIQPLHPPNPSPDIHDNPLDTEKLARLYIKAPNCKGVWVILKAFARVTNGDNRVLKRVWEQMESKFGESGNEGWTGWREDTRLEVLRSLLY